MSNQHTSEYQRTAPSLGELLWRETLGGEAIVPTGRRIFEWGELLARSGAEDLAAILFDVAALHLGFGSWREYDGGRPSGRGEGWTLQRALSDLQEIATRLADTAVPTFNSLPKLQYSGIPNNPLGIGPDVPISPMPEDIAATAAKLRRILEDRSGAELGDAEGILAALRETNLRFPRFDFRVYRHGPLPALVTAIATIGLIDFALSTRDLTAAPCGSITLLHRSAHLDPAGLGPYFSNIGRLTRHSQDVFDLARSASKAQRSTGNADNDAGPWIALLTRGCHGALMLEIIDDLGDLAAEDVLSAILDRVASRPDSAIDVQLIMRLRDAALDNLDYQTAAKAQEVLVRLFPDQPLEKFIHGSIMASGGEFAKAEDLFRSLLADSPEDEDIFKRLLAVKANRFDEFAVSEGYGSPADRRDYRKRRRQVVPHYPRRVGTRIAAVDV